LDSMETQHLSLSLVEAEHDDFLSLVTRFVDDLIDGWSRYSAEIVALSLQQKVTQQALAEQLGIRQPSVHKRLRAARWALLADTLACLEKRLADPDARP
ncbi:MAG TPA: hypothetical protein VLO12_07730, partial [Halomonas sp.]|nr:hypothetical protein [Halomonas sp.]